MSYKFDQYSLKDLEIDLKNQQNIEINPNNFTLFIKKH